MPLIPTEQEVHALAERAKWLAKVEGIPLDDAIDRVTRDWEKKARDEREQLRQERQTRAHLTLDEGKKPLTTSLGDLLKAKKSK